MNYRLKEQQQAMMQQSLMQQHALYRPLLLPPQIEPMFPSGNLPPGFDSSTCRSVYVGNIHLNVSELDLQNIFLTCGAIEGCKLIKKDKSSYGFVDYLNHTGAQLAIVTLNGRPFYGQPIKVNWAYASNPREDTSGHFNIFVGDLSPEITDSALYTFFQEFPSCSDAKVMWDQKTGRSRGFGFVSFRNQQDAQNAINASTGRWLGNRQIRCNWATKGAGTDDKQNSDSKCMADLTTVSADDVQEIVNDDAPENNPQCTSVYVGNLAPEVTQVDLHRFFYGLNAGQLVEIRIQRDKGFGFVRYSNHSEAAMAIQMGNAKILYGKPIKCSWGSKPTPPGDASNPLPPPAPVPIPSISRTELAAYQRSLAFSKMGVNSAALRQAQLGPYALKQAMGLGTAGASQALYDGAFPDAQQLMYLQ